MCMEDMGEVLLVILSTYTTVWKRHMLESKDLVKLKLISSLFFNAPIVCQNCLINQYSGIENDGFNNSAPFNCTEMFLYTKFDQIEFN